MAAPRIANANPYIPTQPNDDMCPSERIEAYKRLIRYHADAQADAVSDLILELGGSVAEVLPFSPHFV